MFPWTEKEASRKYIDLIKRSSAWWANWTPAIQIEAGDYGEIDSESGEFVKEGNIYTSDPCIKGLADQYKLVSGETLEDFIITSSNAKQCQPGADVHVNVAGFANASLKGQWQFDHSRGALLIMHMPRITSVPNTFLAAALDHGLLKDKILVTHVYTCPAFALYLSNKSKETVSLALAADVPIVAAPGVSAGAGISTKWGHDGTSGLFQKGCRDGALFAPLYSIKKITQRRKRRESFDENAPVGDFWADAQAPWGYLDDDGKEEVIDYLNESDSD